MLPNAADGVTAQVSLQAEVTDIEDLMRTATVMGEHAPCPYFLTRKMAQEADILFVPYSYLVDPDTRRTLPR